MLLLVVALIQAASTPPAHSAVLQEKPIIVVGHTVAESERALADCIARGCSPKEEIDASLAHAENQYLVGDYEHAYETLVRARHRNAKYSRDLPVDVSDLMRATGRLAALNGLARSARINSIDALDALKSGLPENDRRILAQRLAVGDSFARDGRIIAARDVYSNVAKQAHAAGEKRVEGYALFRIAGLYIAAAKVDYSYRNAALDALRVIDETTDPDFAAFRQGAKVLRCRLAGDKGDPLGINCVKSNDAGPTTTAELVYAPPIDLDVRIQDVSTVVVVQGDPKPQWIDVSFWIAPDGSVHDIDTVRQSPNASGPWLDRVSESISKRVYRPLRLAATDPGLRRIERFSLFYDRVPIKGTRISGRSVIPRVETLDLTVEPSAS